jgi:hypothetical protein
MTDCDFGHTDKMDIKSISFDEKSNSVTISGPFDAEKVCRKLCCRAGRVIKDMNIKGKDGGGDKAAPKPAEKEAAGKPEMAKDGKADKKEGKAEKDGKAEKPAEKKEAKAQKDGKAEKPVEKKDAKAETKDAKPADKEKPKDAKPVKKVTFKDGTAEAKPVKAMPMADVGPLLEKMMAANKVGPEPPRGEPIAAQGVAVPSIWPAPSSSVAGYGYTPSAYDPSYYGGGYGGGYGYGGCGCGYAAGYCRCGKPALPAGGYYGMPVYDNQGWYYGGGRQPYYPQQQACCEDPNAGCSVM